VTRLRRETKEEKCGDEGNKNNNGVNLVMMTRRDDLILLQILTDRERQHSIERLGSFNPQKLSITLHTALISL